MQRVIFLTTNPGKHAEIEALLAREAGVEVERRTETLPVPPSVIPADVARFRAIEAYRALGVPVFAEALAIELADGMVSGSSYRQAFEQPGGSSWLKKHDGAVGIAHIAVGYSSDGVEARVFSGAIKGTLRATPRGRGNAAWERCWIPEGREQTFAELSSAEELRNGPYLALAKFLRSSGNR